MRSTRRLWSGVGVWVLLVLGIAWCGRDGVRASSVGTQGHPGQNLYVADGDSITFGTGLSTPSTQNYASQAVGLLTGSITYHNVAVAGNTCLDRDNAAPAAVDVFVSTVAGATAVLSIDCGINDMNQGQSPAQAFARLVAYVTHRKAAGWTKILVFTLIDSSIGGSESNRATFNASVISGAAGNGYTVVDVGSDAIMGCATCRTNGTYFQSDQIHPTFTGQGVMAASPWLVAALSGKGLN